MAWILGPALYLHFFKRKTNAGSKFKSNTCRLLQELIAGSKFVYVLTESNPVLVLNGIGLHEPN